MFLAGAQGAQDWLTGKTPNYGLVFDELHVFAFYM